jgi:hypothetical protein
MRKRILFLQTVRADHSEQSVLARTWADIMTTAVLSIRFPVRPLLMPA